MKKKDVQIGQTYVAKVSGKLARVRIERESRYGGWDAKNLDTGRQVRIKSAQRLRCPARPKHGSRPGAPQTTLTLEEIAALERKRDDMVVVIPSTAQRQADAEAGNPGATEYAAAACDTTPLEDLPDGETCDADHDPDVCATVGCDRPAAMTYLGRPRCQECYEDDVADGGEISACAQSETPNHEEIDMARSKKTKTTKATKQPKAAGDTKIKRLSAAKLAGDLPDRQAGAKVKRLSAISAAAQVLYKAGKPMNAQAMVAAMAEQGLWTSPGGKTPHATLYAAIMREIGTKGDAARFRKVERGQFEFAG